MARRLTANEGKPDVACSDCGKMVSPMALFPKGRCVDCHAESPEGQRMVSADELTEMWGGPARRSSSRRTASRRTAGLGSLPIGAIVAYEGDNPPLLVGPGPFVVVSEFGQWVDGEFTLRSIQPGSGYPFLNSDLQDPGWRLVSA